MSYKIRQFCCIQLTCTFLKFRHSRTVEKENSQRQEVRVIICTSFPNGVQCPRKILASKNFMGIRSYTLICTLAANVEN